MKNLRNILLGGAAALMLATTPTLAQWAPGTITGVEGTCLRLNKEVQNAGKSAVITHYANFFEGNYVPPTDIPMPMTELGFRNAAGGMVYFCEVNPDDDFAGILGTVFMAIHNGVYYSGNNDGRDFGYPDWCMENESCRKQQDELIAQKQIIDRRAKDPAFQALEHQKERARAEEKARKEQAAIAQQQAEYDRQAAASRKEQRQALKREADAIAAATHCARFDNVPSCYAAMKARQ